MSTTKGSSMKPRKSHNLDSTASHSSGPRMILILSLILLSLALLGHFFCMTSTQPLTDLSQINRYPFFNEHILGTDSLGRDIFVMACIGARNSLAIGLLAALIAVCFGTFWGAIAAIVSPLISSLMMRTVDALLAIPSLILLLALSALINRPDFINVLPQSVLDLLGASKSSLGILPVISIILVIASTSWLEAARIAFSKIASIRSEEYIEAALSLGAGKTWVLRRHLIPNARSIILIQTSLLISDAVVMEAGLGFLGLGAGPGTPSWGEMLRQAQTDLFYGNWWAPLIPALLISITILTINLIGENMMGRVDG